MTLAFEAADWAGLAAVIAAASTFVGACAAAFVKVLHELRTLKAQNVVQQIQNADLKSGQAEIRTEQAEIKRDVNSNMSDALNKIDDLHGQVADLTIGKRLAEEGNVEVIIETVDGDTQTINTPATVTIGTPDPNTNQE